MILDLQVIAVALLATSWLLAALSDLRNMTIPNAISATMILGFFALAPFSQIPVTAILYCLLAAVLTFAICFLLFAMNVMGGGDAKLLTASALWFGFSIPLIGFLVHTALLGGLLTLVILFLRSKNPFATALSAFLPHSLTNGHKVPYGLAIAASGLLNLNSILQL